MGSSCVECCKWYPAAYVHGCVRSRYEMWKARKTRRRWRRRNETPVRCRGCCCSSRRHAHMYVRETREGTEQCSQRNPRGRHKHRTCSTHSRLTACAWCRSQCSPICSRNTEYWVREACCTRISNVSRHSWRVARSYVKKWMEIIRMFRKRKYRGSRWFLKR